MAYPHWVTPFLEHLRSSCNVSGSCRAVGISHSAAYALRDKDADFAAAWDDALEQAYDELEAEARRRAFEGVDEPVFYQGIECGTVRKYSDGLAQFLLKGYRRRKFGDKTEITGKDGEALIPADETARASRVAQLMALAAKRKDDQANFEDLA